MIDRAVSAGVGCLDRRDGTCLAVASVRKRPKDTRSRSRHRTEGSARRLGGEAHRILAETAADAVFSIDRRSRILFVNPSAEKMFGYSAAEMLGRSLTMVMPDRLRERHEASLARYLATGNRHLDWQAVELTARHKSGREIPVEI